MALISCPECGHKVSEVAQACPSCGHPVGSSANHRTSVQFVSTLSAEEVREVVARELQTIDSKFNAEQFAAPSIRAVLTGGGAEPWTVTVTYEKAARTAQAGAVQILLNIIAVVLTGIFLGTTAAAVLSVVLAGVYFLGDLGKVDGDGLHDALQRIRSTLSGEATVRPSSEKPTVKPEPAIKKVPTRGPELLLLRIAVAVYVAVAKDYIDDTYIGVFGLVLVALIFCFWKQPAKSALDILLKLSIVHALGCIAFFSWALAGEGIVVGEVWTSMLQAPAVVAAISLLLLIYVRTLPDAKGPALVEDEKNAGA